MSVIYHYTEPPDLFWWTAVLFCMILYSLLKRR